MRPKTKIGQVRRLAGKRIYAVTRRGEIAEGKLLRVSGHSLVLRPERINGKKVKTQALLPLVLYDLLAVGTAPYGGYPGPFYPGGYPGGIYPGPGPFYPGYGPNYPGNYPFFR